jgi:hypothetical protein
MRCEAYWNMHAENETLIGSMAVEQFDEEEANWCVEQCCTYEVHVCVSDLVPYVP